MSKQDWEMSLLKNVTSPVNSTSRFLFMVPDEQHKESNAITLSCHMSAQGGRFWTFLNLIAS